MSGVRIPPEVANIILEGKMNQQHQQKKSQSDKKWRWVRTGYLCVLIIVACAVITAVGDLPTRREHLTKHTVDKPVATKSVTSSPVVKSGANPTEHAASTPPASGDYRKLPHCKVTHVSDGDTLTVDCLPKRVRLVGVDTPESTIKKQCYGKEASNYTKQLLGQSVYVEADPASGDLDRYGRPLRYIILEDGTNYNQKLIELGYGMLYVFNHQQFKYKDAFAAAEQRAHNANLGLWGACQTAINKYGNYHVTN